jgi:hypothetical protein
MAIIYTYPVKATPNANDLILISDSQDSNKTKQVTIASLPGGSGSGVSSVTSANAAITVADSSTTPVLTSVAYSGGANIGHVPTGGDNTKFLRGDATWVAITDNDTTIDTKNGGSSVANPTVSLDFGRALTAISGGGGAAAISFSGGLNDLSDVSFTATANGSLYVGQISSAPATGASNVTLGGGTGKIMSSGTDNTLIGSDSSSLLTVASHNVVIGSDSAAAITEGGDNVLIGSDVAATLTTGTDNVIIGKSANISGATLSSTTVIGESASGAADSTVVGKAASASTNGVAIGSGASASGGGIALGKGAQADANKMAFGSSSSQLSVLSSKTAADEYLTVKINGNVRYIRLYVD